MDDISNPFHHGLARFRFAFNKLLLWNLTAYERIVYFDADNVVVHVDKAEELFHCGHFCVVYMNPCHFHTGLLVVRPDAALLADMLRAMVDTGSYDGADQGFLSAFFQACDEAPMFNPAAPSNRPLNQLHISYNMHALYALGTGSFQHFRCGPFLQTPDEPVASIGYPVPTVIKPWFWWVGLLGHAAAWQEVRNTLDEPDLPAIFASILALQLVALYIAHRAVARVVAGEFRTYWWHRHVPALGVKKLALAVSVVSIAAGARVGLMATPRLIRPAYGLVLCGVAYFAVMTLCARLLLWLVAHVRWQVSGRTWLPSMAAYVLLLHGRACDGAVAVVLGWGMHTSVLRAFVVLPAALLLHLTVLFHAVQPSPFFAS